MSLFRIVMYVTFYHITTKKHPIFAYIFLIRHEITISDFMAITCISLGRPKLHTAFNLIIFFDKLRNHKHLSEIRQKEKKEVFLFKYRNTYFNSANGKFSFLCVHGVRYHTDTMFCI